MMDLITKSKSKLLEQPEPGTLGQLAHEPSNYRTIFHAEDETTKRTDHL